MLIFPESDDIPGCVKNRDKLSPIFLESCKMATMDLNIGSSKKIERGAWLAQSMEQATLDQGRGCKFEPHVGCRDDLKVKL